MNASLNASGFSLTQISANFLIVAAADVNVADVAVVVVVVVGVVGVVAVVVAAAAVDV